MPDILNIQFNGDLDIATGRSRVETNWKNKESTWASLVEKVSTTHRTAETQAEYAAAKKGRQAEIKDIGGFVGGYLTGGRRKSGSVLHRQLITLDIDFSKGDFWEDFQMAYGNAGLMYSTHKHSNDNPRLRLILPLDRSVRPDEYEAIARRVAGVIGIELFDPTTFQPERLMYWPSSSKDADYAFEFQDGAWLNADEVLGSYHDWKDSSAWPVSEAVGGVVKRAIAKQGDPLEKPGVVGAFCRTYTVQETIETFLTEVYDSCIVENRFSYLGGSTAAGLIVYDDKYAYSHHGTDPTSGKLCNAFDLVRIHKFGLRDEDARVDTPGNKLPSYVSMLEFCTKDVKVKKQLGAERLADAKGDFADFEVLNSEEEPNTDWVEKLEVDRKGNVQNSIDNIYIILENDPYFKNRIAYDDFEKCEVAIADLPWRKIQPLTRRLIDKDDSNMRHYLEKTYNINSALKTKDAMQVLAIKTSFHPVKDYLSSVEWDGLSRVDRLLVEYQGAVDNNYTRTVTRKMLVAAVARVFKPGVKFDHVLTLVGEQGMRKSSLIAKLGKQWFSDSFATIKGREAFEQLQGVWLVEIAELAGLAKAEVEAIKHFITKRDDRYRVAFGYRVESFPRQCVFFATTNKRDFLKDYTGGRRFWPVMVNIVPPTKDVFKDLTDCEIDQIWAEAVTLFKKGETIFLSPEEEQEAALIQKAHTEEHPWTGLVQMFLDTKLPETWAKLNRYERVAFLQGDELAAEGVTYRSRVCVLEIWNEGLNRRDTIDERSATVIHNILRSLDDWKESEKATRINLYGIQRRSYFRANVPDEILKETPVKNVTKMLQGLTNKGKNVT